jgi:hypothetical protein
MQSRASGANTPILALALPMAKMLQLELVATEDQVIEHGA